MNGKKLSAREYLTQLQQLNEVINQDLERLEDMKIQATSTRSICYDEEHVQTSTMDDILCKSVVKYVDFEKEINEEISKFVNAKEQIIKEIRGLHNINYIQVLYKVYVQFKSIRQTSKEMVKSYGYIVELHNKALIAFEETYKNLSYLY